MSTTKERSTTDDWVNDAYKRLDLILTQAKDYEEEDETLPSSTAVAATKYFLSKCASHLNLDQPEFRLSPNGDIYSTWVVDGWQHVMCFSNDGKPSYYTDYEASDYLPEKVVFAEFVKSSQAA
jgi:hypothetical protein